MSGGGGFGGTGANNNMGIAARSYIRLAYPPGTLEKTQKTLADDLCDRGIEPKETPVIIEEPKCRCCFAVTATILICTVLFFVIWELT